MFRFQGILVLQLIAFIVGRQVLYAQEVPWSFTPSSLSHTIFIAAEHVPLIDGLPLDSGDYIGVFYLDEAGLLVNGGFTQWKGVDTYITAYGADGYVDGFKTGEAFTYKVWRTGAECAIIDYEVGYLTGGLYNTAGEFMQNGISGILSWVGKSIAIGYPKTAMCTDEGEISPQYSANVEIPISYQSEVGLFINSVTGAIDAGQSQPGSYAITVNTEACVNSKTFNMTINSSPVLSLPDQVSGCDSAFIQANEVLEYSYLWSSGDTTPALWIYQTSDLTLHVTSPNQCVAEKTVRATVSPHIDIAQISFQANFTPCENEGQVVIDTYSYIGGIAPYTYQLRDIKNNAFTSEDGTFNYLPVGYYNLLVTDSLFCSSEITDVLITNDYNCDELVIVPNNPPYNSLFIQDSGYARIYDRNGTMRYEMTVPAFWDGSNQTGEILPMGAYLVLVNNKKKFVVTIVK
jgi:hypothetical protein